MKKFFTYGPLEGMGLVGLIVVITQAGIAATLVWVAAGFLASTVLNVIVHLANKRKKVDVIGTELPEGIHRGRDREWFD
ncbi:hypothetical protein D3C79_613680 [compost metagenome]